MGVTKWCSVQSGMAFVHLRTHTEFSVVDGTLRIDDLAQAAAKDGQVALAITDLANLFGGIKFYSACRKKGIKPLLGADCWLEPEGTDKQPSRLLLLVQNTQGYLNLCELLSRAWIQNVQRNQACLKWEWLEELGEGLICLSGAQFGGLGQALLSGDKVRARDWAGRLDGDLPAALLHRVATGRSARPGGPGGRPACRSRPSWDCRWWRRIRCSSSPRRSSTPMRPASAWPRARP